MDRCEQACKYHEQGCNCSQSVLAAFSDVTGLDEQTGMKLGAGFGAGAGTGELCGAVSGAVMVLGLADDENIKNINHSAGENNNNINPVEYKRRVMKLSKELQARFREIFGALRCQELLKLDYTPDEKTPAASRLGVTNHCRMMIVTAVELTEKLLKEKA